MAPGPNCKGEVTTPPAAASRKPVRAINVDENGRRESMVGNPAVRHPKGTDELIQRLQSRFPRHHENRQIVVHPDDRVSEGARVEPL